MMRDYIAHPINHLGQVFCLVIADDDANVQMLCQVVDDAKEKTRQVLTIYVSDEMKDWGEDFGSSVCVYAALDRALDGE